MVNRNSFSEVLLLDVFKDSLLKINTDIPENAIDDAIKQLIRIDTPDLIANNEIVHRMITEGIKVTYRKNGEKRGNIVKLIDFKNIENNSFIVINQFTVIENNINKRPDIVLFLNGIPLVVIELKNPADEHASIKSAYNQIQTYKQVIPSLFKYNEIIIISDGLEARTGSLSAGFDRFMAWKSIDGRREASNLMSQLEVLIKGLLNRKTFLDYIRFFIVFDKSRKIYNNGLSIVRITKKIAAYHQYYAVNKAIESTIRAIGENSNYYLKDSPKYYGLPDVEDQKKGDKKAGVIWHTQGSGKSISMVFYSGKIIQLLNNPTILVITDRNDLDDQLFDTFASSVQLLRQEPIQAETREHLKKLLKIESGGVIFTTIHKFWPEEGNIFETLSERENIIVIVDEAHRSQYGFKAKLDKSTGNVKYGFAKYLRDALPEATFIAFTGTPIEKIDKNTPAVFGNYIDIYDISHAVEDGVTVPIYYESRLIRINLTEEGENLIKEFEEELDNKGLSEVEKAKTKWAKLESLIGSEKRIKQVAQDIIIHFENRLEVIDGKAMVITMTRKIVVKLYNEIINLKPEWHSDNLKKGKIKIVFTSSSSNGPELSKYHTTKEERRVLADRFKDPEDELKMVIVVDMWLTGFDVPCLHTMYIDKPMKGHTLMQAIARVNRVYKDKSGGLIVDYIGIASELKEALSFYAESGGKGDPALKKIINDEIKIRLKRNLVKSRSLMEILNNLIKKYNNRVLTSSEMIEELIKLAKDIKKIDKEPEEMGLTEYEYAFYTAVADNESARELMGKEKLRELAVVLFEKVKKNTSIDWTIRESVRAKLRVIVKRTLRQYGYPPDMQKLATETVLKQAELIAGEII